MRAFVLLLAILCVAPAWAEQVPVQLSCPTDHVSYHVSYVCPTVSCVQVAAAYPVDCEWNGINDAGPSDSDASDPIDPLVHWDYWLASNLLYNDATIIPGPDFQIAHTVMFAEWQEMAGTSHFVDIELESNTGHAGYVRIICDGLAEMWWRSGTGAPDPAWTAPSNGRCVMQHVFQVTHDPAQPVEEPFGEENVKVWRITGGGGGGGCGIGAELALLLPLIHKLRRRAG